MLAQCRVYSSTISPLFPPRFSASRMSVQRENSSMNQKHLEIDIN
jgi:hypothetical protein